MRRNLSLLLLSFSLCLSSTAQVLCIQCYNQNARVLTDTNNLIVNGGFENTTCPAQPSISFCPSSSQYNCNIANWTCKGGGGSTYAHICDSTFSTIIEGTKAAYFGNYISYACSTGDTSCLSNVGCQVTGIPVGFPINIDTARYGVLGVSLEQTINGLTSGSTYLLEFWAGGEDFGSSEGVFAADVGFGNILLRDPPTSRFNGIGTGYVIVFVATSSSHIIKFTNWGHVQYFNNNTTELILDDVRLFKSSGEEGNPCGNSIDDLTKNAITVFPNPVADLFTISTNLSAETEVIVYDIASRKLLQEKFIKEVSLNIAHLAKGVYLYQVTDTRGITTRGKLVKE